MEEWKNGREKKKEPMVLGLKIELEIRTKSCFLFYL